MSSNKSETKCECCSGHHSKKMLMLGVALMVTGFLLQIYSIMEVMMIVGVVLVVKSIILMMYKKDK